MRARVQFKTFRCFRVYTTHISSSWLTLSERDAAAREMLNEREWKRRRDGKQLQLYSTCKNSVAASGSRSGDCSTYQYTAKSAKLSGIRYELIRFQAAAVNCVRNYENEKRKYPVACWRARFVMIRSFVHDFIRFSYLILALLKLSQHYWNSSVCRESSSCIFLHFRKSIILRWNYYLNCYNCEYCLPVLGEAKVSWRTLFFILQYKLTLM